MKSTFMSILAFAIANVAGGGELLAQGRCTTYNCDGIAKCTWKVSVITAPMYEALDDKQYSGGGSHAKLQGYTTVAPVPMALDGLGISAGSGAKAVVTSTAPAVEVWEVKHVRPCKACRHSEGRGWSRATVAFRGRAEMQDPGNSDALAECAATLGAEESTTHLRVRATGKVKAASSGSSSSGVSASPGVTPGGSISVSKDLGNQHKVIELFSDAHVSDDVEANLYHVQMTSSVDRSAIDVDGNFIFIALAALQLETTAYELHLYLTCDWCNGADSIMTLDFPQ